MSRISELEKSTLLDESQDSDGLRLLDEPTVCWLGGLRTQLPDRFWIHSDAQAGDVARRMGVAGFTMGNHVVLGHLGSAQRDAVLRHELVHLVQIERVRRGWPISPDCIVEQEAVTLASLPQATTACAGADPERLHSFLFIFVAVGVGLYVLLRPTPANAPGPQDAVQPPVPTGRIVAEALAFFVVPGGALSLSSRISVGFFASSALAGAASGVADRTIGDVSAGRASAPLLYVKDAATGALIGFIVPGGFRLLGKAVTYPLDHLATYGLSSAQIRIAQVLADRAAVARLNAAQAQEELARQGPLANVSRWYLDRRGLILLYRGQELDTGEILSPLAREKGVAASVELYEQLLWKGSTREDIASFSARYSDQVFDSPRPRAARCMALPRERSGFRPPSCQVSPLDSPERMASSTCSEYPRPKSRLLSRGLS